MQSQLEFKNIRQAFIQRDRVILAIDQINFAVEAGEFVSLIGPSGCGKTTLLGMVAGQLAPSEGTVLYEGKGISGTEPIAYMLARDALYPWLSVRENVELGLLILKVPLAERRARAEEWLIRVGLQDFMDFAITKLSQGMRQRVAIARTLVLAPKCILMDEPFAALDAQTRLIMRREFLNLWERTKLTTLFVTHDIDEAIALSDRIVMLSARPGRIIQDLQVKITRPRDLRKIFENKEFLELRELLTEELRRVLVSL